MKAEAQRTQVQSQPAQRGGGAMLESPQGEQIAQLEAMAERSTQVDKQAQLAAMANSGSRMSAQRKAISAIYNSPNLTAQRQQLDSLAGKGPQSAQAGVPIQLSGREGDEWDPGPGQGEQAPPTPRPGQGGQERPPPSEGESLIQDGYSPRAGEERDETAQLAKAGESPQRKVAQCADVSAKTNKTGLPDNLKSGFESLSGMAMDNVRVHYNSSQPAQLNALAYAQGTDIHVAPGQEKHLPHEAWHVVQQAQGRVKPTMQMKEGVPVNDDAGLEHEADVMGARATQMGAAAQAKKTSTGSECAQPKRTTCANSAGGVVQWATEINYAPGYYTYNSKTHVVGSQMIAYLDTTDEVNGSEPGSGVQKELMEDLKNVGGYKSMIRGHLLNDNVGGLGIAMNLFPITSQANSRHKNYVESYVKQAIKDDGKAGSKGRLIYRVSVAPRPEDVDAAKPEASFVCDAAWENGEKVVSNTIESKPVSGGTGSGNVADTSAVSKTFKTKDLPSGWGKKGAGYDERLHGEVRKKTQIHGMDGSKLTGTEFGHYGKGTPEIDVVAEECRTIVEDTYEDTSSEYLEWMATIDDHEKDDDIDSLLSLLASMTS